MRKWTGILVCWSLVGVAASLLVNSLIPFVIEYSDNWHLVDIKLESKYVYLELEREGPRDPESIIHNRRHYVAVGQRAYSKAGYEIFLLTNNPREKYDATSAEHKYRYETPDPVNQKFSNLRDVCTNDEVVDFLEHSRMSIVRKFGFPYLATRFDYVVPRIPGKCDSVEFEAVTKAGVAPRTFVGSVQRRIVWKGLAANCAIGAVVCVAIRGCVWLAVHMLRRLRGVCVGCGYHVEPGSRCPECGTYTAIRAAK